MEYRILKALAAWARKESRSPDNNEEFKDDLERLVFFLERVARRF